MRRVEEAAIRDGFAYLFFMAMQETCMATRLAMISRLEAEQAAALRNAQNRARDAEATRTTTVPRHSAIPEPRRPTRRVAYRGRSRGQATGPC